MTEHPLTPVASNGEVRLCKVRCTTCIYRPGNLMYLAPGRRKQLAREALDIEGHIVCHKTLNTPLGAICRGFADLPAAQERSLALRWAAATGTLTEIDPDTIEHNPSTTEASGTD